MRYLKETLDYILVKGKGIRFLSVFIVLLIPSAMIAYGLPAEKFFANLIHEPNYANFGETWLSFFTSPLTIVSVAVGLLFAATAFACVIGVIITHFRVGTFSLKYVGRSLNDYFVPAIAHSLFFIVDFIVNYTIFALLIFIWHKYANGVTYTVLGFVSGAILLSVFVYILSSLTVWLPTMSIKGDYGLKTFTDSFYKSRSKQKYFLPTHIFITLILLAMGAISHFVHGPWYVSLIIDSIGYAACLTLYIVYCFVVYFNENGLPREDLVGSPYKRRR